MVDIRDIISTVLDLSKKGAEYNDEIAQLNLTMMTLQQAYEHLTQAEEGYLNANQLDAIQSLLEQASSLIHKVSKQNNWWRNLKSLLPGNDLEQIKEIDSKIQRTVQMLQFSMKLEDEEMKLYQNEQGKKQAQDFDMATLPIEMIQPTIQMNDQNTHNSEAFSLKMLCSDKSARQIAKDKKMQTLFAFWNEPKISICRLMFQGFPPLFVSYISKEHCVITGKKEIIKQTLKQKKIKNNKLFLKQKQDNNDLAMIGPTLNIEDLCLDDKKDRSNSREKIKKRKLQISSQNSSNNNSKILRNKKSNPSIKVNGQKVLDSDLDDKRFNSQNLLKVKQYQRDSVSSIGGNSSQYLSVNCSSSMRNSIQGGKIKNNRMKMSDSDDILEQDSNQNSQNDNSADEIFYTCPQIEDNNFVKQKKPKNDNNQLSLLSSQSQSSGSEYEEQIIETVKQTFEIQDLSTNGTYLNGQKLGKGVKKSIRDGDEIGIIVFIVDDNKQNMTLGYKFRDAT